MGIEIERKYLVTHHRWREGLVGTPYVQGYVAEQDYTTLRVRLAGTVGVLTIKGPSTGATRAEFEYTIPADDVRAMLGTLCQGGHIDKTRYKVPVGKHVWDVDVFHGDNDGLIVAEIELDDVDEPFARPDWLGEEVTHDVRYFNSALAKRPYRSWTS